MRESRSAFCINGSAALELLVRAARTVYSVKCERAGDGTQRLPDRDRTKRERFL